MDTHETLPDEIQRDFTALERATKIPMEPLEMPHRTEAPSRDLRRVVLAAAVVIVIVGSFFPIDREDTVGQRISISVSGPGAANALSSASAALTDILGSDGVVYESSGTHFYSGLSSSADEGTMQRVQRVVTTLVSQGLSVQIANAGEVVRTKGPWIHPEQTRSLRIELLAEVADGRIETLRRRIDELGRNDVTLHKLETTPGAIGIEIRHANDEELPLALLLEGLGLDTGGLPEDSPLAVESLRLRTEYSGGSTAVIFEDGRQVRTLELLGDYRGRESELREAVQAQFDGLELHVDVDWVDGEWILNRR